MSHKFKRVVVAVEYLVDGQERTVDELRITNRASVAYEFAAKKAGWGIGEDTPPMLWMTFVSWYELVDRGDYPAEAPNTKGGGVVSTFQRFRERDCLGVERVKTEPVDPTAEDGEPSSQSQPSPDSTPTG
jgi:hypothetical protein